MIYLIGKTGQAFNGSEIQLMQTGKIEGCLFDFDLEEEVANQKAVLSAIQEDFLQSAHDLGEGG